MVSTERETTLPVSQLGPDTVHRPAASPTPIVVLTGGGPLAWIIINAVIGKFGSVTVLQEQTEPMRLLFRRRLKKLGAVTVAGQIAFGVAQRLLRAASRHRLQSLFDSEKLAPTPAAGCAVIPVASVNSEDCRRELVRIGPTVVLVVGARIIGRATLASINAPFINYHAGVNPKYRGMCGGYWALASGDPEHFGATVHLVDQGVDTGGILYWQRVTPGRDDNFVTYPFRLAASGRALVLRAMDDALTGQLRTIDSTLPSKQWYHPTLWGYLRTGLRRRVW